MSNQQIPSFTLSLALIALAAFGAGCQRHSPQTVIEQHTGSMVRYPWQQPDWQSRTQEPAIPDSAQQPEGAKGEVVIPNDQGRHPVLGSQDTFDVGLLVGEWMLVCYVDQEILIQRPPDSFYVFKFAEGGTLNFLPTIDGQIKDTVPGTWEKTGPGKLLMSLRNAAPLTYFVEFFGQDFVYFWTSDTKNGLWLVRRPPAASLLIEGNDFTFTSGQHLRLTGVKGDVFTGYLEGAGQRQEVSGGYSQGVLMLHWVDTASKSDGYAAFTVSPDWKELNGVWWLNDYTTSPFGGSWHTEGARNIQVDPAGQAAAQALEQQPPTQTDQQLIPPGASA